MRKFGLIGFPLGHSFSGKYFKEKFQRESITHTVYNNYAISGMDQFPDLLADPELEGLNVTIPYKESVIPFLNHKDPVVEDIAACNCIRIRGGLLTGFNTDVKGFEESVTEKLQTGDTHALILGTGGSSKAVAWVLKQKGIRFLFVSRNKSEKSGLISYQELSRDMIESHSLIINCTPAGTFPDVHAYPPIPYEWIGQDHYLFDLVYNPSKTSFLEKGEARGARIKNGADMLAIQAEASWAIWNE